MILKRSILLIMFTILSGLFMTAYMPQPVYAAGACESRFLGFPSWFRGITDSDCQIVSPGDDIGGFIWRVALNIIEIIMVAIGYISGFFILFGGFQYLTSQGSSEGIKKAKNSIVNAIIGLVISLMAIGIINFIMSGLGFK